MISTILLVLAAIALGAAALNINHPKVSMFPLGMFIWALSVLTRGL